MTDRAEATESDFDTCCTIRGKGGRGGGGDRDLEKALARAKKLCPVFALGGCEVVCGLLVKETGREPIEEEGR